MNTKIKTPKRAAAPETPQQKPQIFYGSNLYDACVAGSESAAREVAKRLAHAQALAEALQDIMLEFRESDNDAEHLMCWMDAKSALAAWRKDQ
jgi:hypothetical protein